MLKQVFKYISFFVFVYTNSRAQPQNNKGLATLFYQLKQAKTDTAKVNRLNNIALVYLSNNDDSTVYYSNKAISLAQKNNYWLGKTKAYINLINAYRHLDSTKKSLYLISFIEKEKFILRIDNKTEQNKAQADWLYAKARLYENSDSLEYAKKMYKQSLQLSEKENYVYLLAKNYIGLRFIAYKQDQVKEAIKYAFSSIPHLEKINDNRELMKSYNLIATLYGRLNESEKGINYHFKSLEYAFKTNNLHSISLEYCNLGIAYHEIGYKNKIMYDSALVYAKKSFEIASNINDTILKVYALSLIGSCYLNKNQFQQSLIALHQGLGFASMLNDDYYKITISDHLGELYQKTGKIDSAIYYGKKSFEYAKNLNELVAMQWSAENLYKTYQLKGDFENAFKMQKTYYTLRDSIHNQENQKELINQELKYKYDKQAVADSLKYDADRKIKDFKTNEMLGVERSKRIILSVCLALAIGLGFFAFNRYRVAQKQKQIIEKQKQNIEDKSKEIQDSILYAKEIQDVFLKNFSKNNSFFKNASLVYKPKDIVSGDFYWHKEVDNNLFVVVGDCTGHGIPGAIISVLAIQSLEKRISDIVNTNELHLLNNLIREDFNTYYQKNRRVSVGLDYSIICINKQQQQIYISGSGHSVFLRDKTNKIISERFSSINIGGSMPMIYEPHTACYKTEEIQQLFLFTDGITDQKGGPQNKKLSSRGFVSFLDATTVSVTPLESFVNDWIGNNEQLDDITALCLNL